MDNGDQIQQVPEPKYECLLFDLDETLYPLSSGLSADCAKNITEYMIKKLDVDENKVYGMCVQLHKEYGTIMAGLTAIGYDVDYDDYISFVDGGLPYEVLKPEPVLRNLLHSLPIRKVIFTNANEAHVAKVLGRLGLEDCFEGVICFETLNPAYANKSKIEHCRESNVVPVLPKAPIFCKPFEDAFKRAFKIAEINPHRTLFFDDSLRNLQTGKRMGLHTVLVGSSHRPVGVDHAFESIHNIKEELPELWGATEKSEDIR